MGNSGMKISGDTLYALLRYAHKHDIFDDKRQQREVTKCFLELRGKSHPLRTSSRLEYSIKPTKIGNY